MFLKWCFGDFFLHRRPLLENFFFLNIFLGVFFISFVFFEPSVSEFCFGLALMSLVILLIQKKITLPSQLSLADKSVVIFLLSNILGTFYAFFTVDIAHFLSIISFAVITFYSVGLYYLIRAAIRLEQKSGESILRAFFSGIRICTYLSFGFFVLLERGVVNNIIFYDVRARGFVKDPNVFAALLVASLLYEIIIAIKKETTQRSFYLSPNLLILGTMFVLTFSRGGVVNLITSVVVLLFLMKDKKFFSKKMIIQSVVWSILLPAMILSIGWSFNEFHRAIPFLIFHEPISEQRYKDVSRSAFEKQTPMVANFTPSNLITTLFVRPGAENLRVQLLEQTIKIKTNNFTGLAVSKNFYRAINNIWRNFLFGVGPGFSSSLWENFFHKKLSIHNSFLRVVIENGFIGIFSFIVFLYALFKKTFSEYSSHLLGGDNYQIKCLFLAILSGILTQGMVIDILHWRFFWVLLGLMF